MVRVLVTKERFAGENACGRHPGFGEVADARGLEVSVEPGAEPTPSSPMPTTRQWAQSSRAERRPGRRRTWC